jgi:hypothetical protein
MKLTFAPEVVVIQLSKYSIPDTVKHDGFIRIEINDPNNPTTNYIEIRKYDKKLVMEWGDDICVQHADLHWFGKQEVPDGENF